MRRLRFRHDVIILFWLSLIYQSLKVDGVILDLFAEKDRHGMSIRLDVSDSECSNFPVTWASKAASINTLGSCVQLYDEPFCKGSLTIIQPFHTIHQMDMSLINFANRIQSASACGPKIKTARYVVQNAADASILTVNSKFGGFGRAFTTNTSTVITKAQQWDVIELSNSEYSLKPREYEDNYPVSYDEESLKKGQIKKKLWKLMSVGRGRYLIKHEPSQRCLYKTEDNRVEEHDCRIWSPNQEWVLKEIFGNLKPAKSNSAAGPGANYNILSKVASYVPPTKPPPQFLPIYYNATALASAKRRTTAAPYIVRKKIKRGPRPKTKPIVFLSNIRLPGLRDRPALSNQFSNSNKFLLLKNPGKVANLTHVNLKEFVPSDDRIETYAYYQQVLLAQEAKAQQLLMLKAQAQAQALAQAQGRPPPFPPSNKDTGSNVNDDDDDDDSSNTKKNKRKKKNKDEEDSEEEEDDTEDEGEEDSEEEDGPEKKPPQSDQKNRPGQGQGPEHHHGQGPRPGYGDGQGPPGPPRPQQISPYDIDYSKINHTIPQDEISSGFFKSVFSKVKSGLSKVPIPFMSSSDSKNSTAMTHDSHPHGYGPPEHDHHNMRPSPPDYPQEYTRPIKPKRKHKPNMPYPNLYRPLRPKDVEYGEAKTKGPSPGLRLPKRKSSTTTTVKPILWGFLG